MTARLSVLSVNVSPDDVVSSLDDIIAHDVTPDITVIDDPSQLINSLVHHHPDIVICGAVEARSDIHTLTHELFAAFPDTPLVVVPSTLSASNIAVDRADDRNGHETQRGNICQQECMGAIETRPLDVGNVQDANNAAKGTILVVDDEPTLLELYADILESVGFDVLAAIDGRRGLELFEAQIAEIDLVILDWAMPNMHGRDCLNALQALAPDTPIIVASGYYIEDRIMETVAERTKAVLNKPFSAGMLIDVVQKTIAGVPIDTNSLSMFSI